MFLFYAGKPLIVTNIRHYFSNLAYVYIKLFRRNSCLHRVSTRKAQLSTKQANKNGNMQK